MVLFCLLCVKMGRGRVGYVQPGKQICEGQNYTVKNVLPNTAADPHQNNSSKKKKKE